jgi:hypothetical protein
MEVADNYILKPFRNNAIMTPKKVWGLVLAVREEPVLP